MPKSLCSHELAIVYLVNMTYIFKMEAIVLFSSNTYLYG